MKRRAYKKSEIALLFYPGLSVHGALTKLRREILASPALYNRLLECGYQTHSFYFSMKQVDLIFEYFGQP